MTCPIPVAHQRPRDHAWRPAVHSASFLASDTAAASISAEAGVPGCHRADLGSHVINPVVRRHTAQSLGVPAASPMFTSRVPITSRGGRSPDAGSLHDGSSCRSASAATGEALSAEHVATKQMTSMPCGDNPVLSTVHCLQEEIEEELQQRMSPRQRTRKRPCCVQSQVDPEPISKPDPVLSTHRKAGP